MQTIEGVVVDCIGCLVLIACLMGMLSWLFLPVYCLFSYFLLKLME